MEGWDVERDEELELRVLGPPVRKVEGLRKFAVYCIDDAVSVAILLLDMFLKFFEEFFLDAGDLEYEVSCESLHLNFSLGGLTNWPKQAGDGTRIRGDGLVGFEPGIVLLKPVAEIPQQVAAERCSLVSRHEVIQGDAIGEGHVSIYAERYRESEFC